MKGQTQPVVLILTATVLVGTITSVYVWGEPLLSKGQSQAEIRGLERNVQDLHQAVITVSESGEGTTETVRIGKDISVTNNFEIKVNEQKNFIEIQEQRRDPPYRLGTWNLIEGRNLQNLTIGEGYYGSKGDDLPGVLAVKPTGNVENALFTYRIDFRNMRSETPKGPILERINLSTGAKSRTADPATIVVTNKGEKWETGSQKVQLPNGEKYDRKNSLVEIALR